MFGITRPAPFPIPTANVTVLLPAGVPYQQVTTGNWDDLYPEWSPDGNSIAYVSNRGGLWSLWVMNSNVSHARQLTMPSLGAGDPSWSPDSYFIAYWRMDGPDTSIFVVNVSGGYSLTASNDLGNVVMATPKWSPDASVMALSCNATGNFHIWTYDASGAGNYVAGGY